MAGSAVIGALRVNLGIDSAQFQDGLKKAQQSLACIGKSMTRVGAGLSAAVTAPIVAFGASIVKTAGDFEASMSRVSAATGATADQMASLETLARELGKTTIFSASEASDAMEVLAKNGLTVEQIPGIFADLAGKMVEIGAQIIQGLWDGLKSKFAEVKAGLQNFGSDLISGFKSFVGVQCDDRLAAPRN